MLNAHCHTHGHTGGFNTSPRVRPFTGTAPCDPPCSTWWYRPGRSWGPGRGTKKCTGRPARRWTARGGGVGGGGDHQEASSNRKKSGWAGLQCGGRCIQKILLSGCSKGTHQRAQQCAQCTKPAAAYTSASQSPLRMHHTAPNPAQLNPHHKQEHFTLPASTAAADFFCGCLTLHLPPSQMFAALLGSQVQVLSHV